MVFIIICAFSVLMLSITSSHAYRTVEASLLAPFEYVAIPFSIFWGIVIFGDWPSSLSWIGMSLILFGGIYAIYREKVREVEIISKVPMPASAAMYQKPNLENENDK
jgi:drug/metabolite transporter (DMT)-like permease